MSSVTARLRDLPFDEVLGQCSNGHISLDYGAATMRLRTSIKEFARAFHVVYGNFRPNPQPEFADFHLHMRERRRIRRWFLPSQSTFLIDGIQPFEPFAAANALPQFEWGLNWSFAQRSNQYVLLHAGALVRNGKAVIMAAPPGSGKSTLAAAMMLHGFRLLSDEFGVLCPETGKLVPMLKPISLKNQSIEIIRQLSTHAVMGPVFKETHKGDVAHLAPNQQSVDAVSDAAQPVLVLFPAYAAGKGLITERIPAEDAFARLAFNSFNYHLLGPIGFEAVADVIESCPAYKLRYSDLDQAIERIGELLDEAGERRGADTA